MGQKVQDIIIDEFNGVDSESDPTNLPLNISPGASIRNMYPSLNKSQIRKRPGISTNLTNVARSGEIYHMVRGALNDAATQGGPDVLFMVYGGGTGAVRAASYHIRFDAIEDYGVTQYTLDLRYMASAVIASRDFVVITAPTAVANWSRIAKTGVVAPFYSLGTYAAADAGAPYTIAAWIREHHWVGNSLDVRASRLLFSGFSTPLTFPAANVVDVEPRGVRDTTRGFFRLGDALYIGKTDRTYVLTGANDETFVIEQTRIPFGFGGMRGWVQLNRGAGIGFVHRSHELATTGGEEEASQVDNIGIIGGLDGETVGDRVVSLVRTTSGGGPTQRAFAESTSSATDWIALLGTLFVPQNGLGFGSPNADIPMLFRNKQDGSFWPWTIEGTLRVLSFAVADDLVHIGCGDGHIRRFDVTLSQDDGVNFPEGTFYQTPPLWQGKPHVKWSVSYVRIYGSQTSGGVASVQIANDFGTLGTAQTLTLGAAGAELQFKGKSGGTEAYFQEVRITLANDSVEGTITKIVIGGILTGKSVT